MQKLYLAGQMSGVKDFNFPAFFELADNLKSIGIECCNPADNDGPTLETSLKNAIKVPRDWEHYMKIDIPRMLDCDGVIVLPGWRKSRGANLEVSLARLLKMPIYIWKDGGIRPLFTILGFSGYAQVGKDASAKLLESSGWERISFADVIRDFLYKTNPMINIKSVSRRFASLGTLRTLKSLVDEVGWERAKVEHEEVRLLMQRAGETARNLLGDNVWVDAAMSRMVDGGKYIFTDVRFPNEAAIVKEFGGKIIRVSRPGYGPINNHISETSMDNYDFDAYVENDGDLNKLRESLEKIIA